MSDEVIKYILECIIEYAHDTATQTKDEFNSGKRLAYFEILNCIKGQLEINDIDLKEYGFDFEPESIL